MTRIRMHPADGLTRRRVLQASIALGAHAVLVGSAACGAGGGRAQDSNTLTVLYPADERSWAFFMPSQFLVFPPLAERGPDGVLRGWLARSWEPAADYRSWTVQLRGDARWHDGVPVTARDVKFTFELLAHPAVAALAPAVYDVVVADDTTFTVRVTRRPEPWWLDYVGIYPKHLLERLDPAKFFEWEFWTRPVGSGPFRYVRHAPHTFMEFDANRDYFRGEPAIARLVLKFGPPSIPALLGGQVDAIPWVEELDLLKLQRDDRFRVYSAIEPDHTRALIWNHRHSPFADARVRRALTLAVDRVTLVRALNLPESVPTFDVPFTHDQFRRGEVQAGLPYDPAAATALLESAGWRYPDGDGIRERAGTQFRFTALVPAGQGFARAAVFVQSRLRAVGVAMDVRTLEAQILAERLKRGDFEAAVWVVNNDLSGDLDHRAFFGRPSLIGYDRPEVAARLDSAAAAFDPAEVDRHYRALAPVFTEELPVTFLYPLVRTTVAHRRVAGLGGPYRHDPVWHADQLSLETPAFAGARPGRKDR